MSDMDEGDRDAKCRNCGAWILEPVGDEKWLCEACQTKAAQNVKRVAGGKDFNPQS